MAIDQKTRPPYLWRCFRSVYRRSGLAKTHANVNPMVVIIYLGTTFMAVCLLLLLLISFFALGHTQVLTSIYVDIGALTYLLAVGMCVHRHGERAASWLLLLFYALVSSMILAMWSINVPEGLLMLGFMIILAGVLLGARSMIPVTVGTIAILVAIQTFTMIGVLHPDTSDLANPPNFGDVAGYGTMLIVFSIIMWLSRLRLEQALQRALRAEAALQKERNSLAIRLEEETRRLKASQLEEMRQLYRFSELGQSSTTLLHEIANHLAVVTLDMDHINKRHGRSKDIATLKQSIALLEKKVDQTRRQLKQNTIPQRFAVQPIVKEVIQQLRHKSDTARVKLEMKTFGRVRYVRGDPQKLFQAITILVTNAIEAYTPEMPHRKVLMVIDRREDRVKVLVTDYGIGITPERRASLFKPFASSKKDGTGIGLFIAKQIIGIHMGGTLTIDPRHDQTTFVIDLPEDES